jgi:hypothetical protein
MSVNRSSYFESKAKSIVVRELERTRIRGKGERREIRGKNKVVVISTQQQ